MLSDVGCGTLDKCEGIAGRCGLSSPRAWTSVVRVAFVKLSGMGMSLVCQVKEVLIVVGSIEDTRYVLSTTTGVCGTRVVLFHTCHLLSEYILETWFVRE